VNPELSTVSWTLTNESNRDCPLMKSTIRGTSSTDKEIGEGGFLSCGRSHFMVQKNLDFSGVSCPNEQRGIGVSVCMDKGDCDSAEITDRRVNFSRCFEHVFHKRLLKVS